MPKRNNHEYKTFRKYYVKEIIEMFKNKNEAILEYLHNKEKASVRIKRNYRMNTILKSQECVNCGLKGNNFRLERHTNTYNKPHLNLYYRTRKNKYIMLTCDHIIPRSEGGNDNEVNLQVLCSDCNYEKDSRIETKYFTPEIIEYIRVIKPAILDGLTEY